MNKMWKNDGVEQKQLEKMFREKEINPTMRPSEVQKKNALFDGFTPHVFRKHWKATKLMFATNIPGASGRNNAANDEIIEIDGTTPPLTKSAKLSLTEDMTTNVLFKQPPIVTTVYTDPDTKQDICLVVIPLLSKIKRIDFDVISTDINQVLQLKYSWPLYSYTGAEMFKKENAPNTFVNKLHPKFLAVEKALEGYRENFEDAPQGTIEVILPATIQLDPATWTNYFNKKSDGTLLVFFEFLCVRSDYVIKKMEKSILLE